jgi:signal transduction histidine kinase
MAWKVGMSFVIETSRDSVDRPTPIRNAIAAAVDAGLIRPLRAIVTSRFLSRSTVELLEERHALENRARDEHLAVMSHELRNALGVVRNAARLLEPKHAGKVDVDSARTMIERQVLQMNRHLDDLLNVSPMAIEGGALQLYRIDLCEIARHTVEAFTPDLARRGHHLTVRLPPNPIWLQADPGRLEQVLGNLMINAAKYTPDGGEITVSVETRGEFAGVCVGDSGIGIAPEMLTSVFGLFVQVDGSARYSEGGRGVGLAVARNFVEMHGGRLSAASAGLGMGSEFTILLPLQNGA